MLRPKKCIFRVFESLFSEAFCLHSEQSCACGELYELHFFSDVNVKSFPANFLEQYCSYRPDIQMARTSKHARRRKASSECQQRASMSIYLRTRKMHFFSCQHEVGSTKCFERNTAATELILRWRGPRGMLRLGKIPFRKINCQISIKF